MKPRYNLPYILTTLCLALCLTSNHANAGQPPYTASQNVQTPRTYIISHKTLNGALHSASTSSEHFATLCGTWRVKYFDSVEKVPTNDLTTDTDIENWGDSIRLPKSWQLEGKDVALYSSTAYPFAKQKPKSNEYTIPTATTVALYQRDITIPFEYTHQMVYLTIGGASSKATLYVNGKEVGYATDSKVAAEYDISPYVVRGRNRVAIVVENYSGGSWLEDQSGWRLSGINRDIYLYVQPKIRVRDVINTTTLNTSYSTGLLKSALLLKTELLNDHTVTIHYSLYDPQGNLLSKLTKDATIDMRREDTIFFNSKVEKVEKWSSESPNLYTVVYGIMREGRYTEFAPVKVGFVEVATKGTQLLINGVPTKIKGVNLEEFSPATGGTLSKQTMESEMAKMRLMGINAIATGGYPLPPAFYHLADSIGFYVVSTANINTAGLENSRQKGLSLSNDPAWEEIFLERITANYEITKNHPSVIALGLGSDAGNGYNMYEGYMAIKNLKSNALVLYSGARSEWNTDIICPHYPTLAQIKKIASTQTTQPIIPLKVEFDQAYWQSASCGGAFIDRWISPSLDAEAKYSELSDEYKLKELQSGRIDIYSAQNDISKISKTFSTVSIKVIDAKEGIVAITNNLTHANLNYFEISYRVITKSRQPKWKSITVDCPPGETVETTLSSFGNGKEVEIQIGNIHKEVVR